MKRKCKKEIKKKEFITELEEMGLESLKKFWGLDIDTIKSLTSSQLRVLIDKAKFGMQFYRETNLNKRCDEKNQIRVLTLISEDKKELQRLIKKSLPRYLSVKP